MIAEEEVSLSMSCAQRLFPKSLVAGTDIGLGELLFPLVSIAFLVLA